MDPSMTAGALAGLRVVDGATLYGAPFVATLLADHGADVVKVEPPGGDDYRHYPNRMWPILARGKRSIVLDLRSDEGLNDLRELIAGADVFVTNMPTMTLLKRKLDYDTLRARNADLIMAHITGFGLGGPYSDRPGNGTIAEAFGGLTHLTGDPDGPPVLASVPLGDAVTGFVGAFGVLAACYHRLANGGPGQLIDINPVDAVLHVIGPAITEYTGGDEVPGRLGSRLRGSLVRNVFRANDGDWVAVSLSSPRQAANLAVLVGHDEVDSAGRPTGDLEGSLRAWATVRSRAEVVAALVDRRLPVAAVNTVRDILDDPHIKARIGVDTVLTSENGPVHSPAPAPRLLGTPAPPHERTPGVGEHAGSRWGGPGSGQGTSRGET
jgi:crotonobetainyl-CoA:carnitine CoA-transferase CaiB-like acyl-CoA transferase